ncbi:MAG: polysaccharide pyruvyl transferase family protein [Parvularculaceae bacterium]|nr:polysaccharide pyruvyl transferase family protein [Parvularculaceae bacterium]
MTDRTVGLLWHSMSSENLGVGALTLGHREIVRAAAARSGVRVRFKVLGWADPKPAYFTADDIAVRSLRLSDFARLDARGFLAEARGCDLVLDIGAGDSFSDIYGPSRILKILAAQNLLRLSGTPYVISPQTIGPFENAVIRRAALGVLKSAALVTARDQVSADYAREMGFSGEVLVSSDVALRLPYEAASSRSGPGRVGLNVSGLLFNAGADRFGLRGDYRELARRALAMLARKPNTRVTLVNHVLAEDPNEDDRIAAAVLAQEFPEAEVAADFKTPSEAKSYIAGLDFFAGSRMHACIAAFSGGVPCVPIAYSRKFSGLFGALGYTRVADLKQQSHEEILKALDRAFDERELVRRETAAALEEGLSRVARYEDALAALVNRLPIARKAA